MISSQAHICAQLHLNTSPPLISALMFQARFDAVKSLLNYSTKVSSPCLPHRWAQPKFSRSTFLILHGERLIFSRKFTA